MTMYNESSCQNIHLTLEQHFYNLSQKNEDIKGLYSLWELLRKDLQESLINSRSVFVYFSLHDSTHSKTVISMIEMFLGEERIRRLSATDTFMLLCCAYAHDYGMALSVDKVYSALGTSEFKEYVETQYFENTSEDMAYIRILYNLIHKDISDVNLQDLYLALVIVVEEYLRPRHWEGVSYVENDFKGLFNGRLKVRIVRSIIEICQLHGTSIEKIQSVMRDAQGAISDTYHPRFVAAMLRLGDLLDLDNNRFPRWFVDEVGRGAGVFAIPELSVLHYRKHESITHFFVSPKRIQVVSKCKGPNAQQVARLVNEWLVKLEKECNYMTKEWAEIAPADFGRPPCLQMKEIFICGERGQMNRFSSEYHALQMKMPQEKVMDLLEGTNIYGDIYVGIRELVQNAVDASLLQMWFDLRHNKYSYMIGKDALSKECCFTDIPMGVFHFYDILIELIRDYDEKEIYIVIKDKGTGIGQEDIQAMANIGEGKEKNKSAKKILNTMPDWMKPSGVFGIGLQSVFQLTDQIDFYSRRPNQPEKKISFYSFGKNKGRIEVEDLNNEEENYAYYDNYTQGTSIKFAINRDKLWKQREKFQYYDDQFDEDNAFDAIFVELAHIIEKKLKETPFDYFNVRFQTMTYKNGEMNKQKKRRLVYSFFAPQFTNEALRGRYRFSALRFYQDRFPLTIDLESLTVIYFDQKRNIYYLLQIRPCQMMKKNWRRYALPETDEKSIQVWYKFCKLDGVEEALNRQKACREDALFFSGVSISLIIFDSPANEYLNIDRNYLKTQANLTLDMIEEAESLMLTELCRGILKRGEGTGKKPFLLYKRETYAVTMLLLFYRYVDPELFKQYQDKMCKEFFTDNGTPRMALGMPGDRQLMEKALKKDWWQLKIKKRLVDFSWPLEEELESKILEEERDEFKGYPSWKLFAQKIPVNYFRITEISVFRYGKDLYMRYDITILRLKKGKGETADEFGGISMDLLSRLLDYGGAFDSCSDYNAIYFESLMKKLFKPDKEYPNLIVCRKPKSFHYGRNFAHVLDYGIDNFILSPFDHESAKMLQKFVDGKVDDNQVWDSVLSSIHFKKCLAYVQKFPMIKKEGRPTEQMLRTDYEKFVRNFCQIVKKYRDQIAKQSFLEEKNEG